MWFHVFLQEAHYSIGKYNTGSGNTFIIIFLRLATFFQLFLKYACSAFAGVDSKSRQSAFKKAILAFSQVFRCSKDEKAFNVFHVAALGEQITNFTKIGIIGNLRDPLLINPHCFRYFFLSGARGTPMQLCVSCIV